MMAFEDKRAIEGVRRLAVAVAFLVGTMTMFGATEAQAQTAGEGVADFDVQTFEPVIGPHGTFTLDRAETIGHLETTGGLYLDYLSEPFVLDRPDAGSQAIVDQQLVADLVAGIGLFGRARLGVHLPVYFANAGDIGDASFSGSGIGDLTFQPKVRILKQPEAPLGLGLLMDISVPTGDANRFIGETTVTAAPRLLVDRRIGRTTIETNLGFLFKENQQVRDVEIGNRFSYGLGGEYAFVEDVFRVGLEVVGHTPLSSAFSLDRSSPMEVLVGAKVKPVSNIQITPGIGTGLIGGIGAPEFRAFLGVSYVPSDEAGGDDPDGDGIAGDEDECPEKAEDFDGFEDEDGCPDPDNDGDGIPDDQDACPQKSAPETEDGCPPAEEEKEEKQGAEQSDDKQKESEGRGARSKGDAVAKPTEPADSDEDGIPDKVDECPETPGVGYTKGCPPEIRRVELKESSIDVLEKIYFVTDSATLKKESYELLDQVALLLRLNPQIKRVEIQGHTDDTGTEKYNQRLSQKRAEAVRQYLVEEAGIAEDRLTAQGYGATEPKVPNVSEENRNRNRRVEFVIVMQESVDGSREGTGSESDSNESSGEKETQPEQKETESESESGPAEEGAE